MNYRTRNHTRTVMHGPNATHPQSTLCTCWGA